MSNEEELELLDKHCAELGEHYDVVQIFVSRFDTQDGTTSVNYGAGNWFARRGQVQEWLEKKNEEARVDVRKEDE